MPTPDRKKSKHKKKEKDSTHRSPSKHKSKKKKTSRSPSRNREKKKDYKKQVQSPMNLGGKGITDMFGGLGFDILKKLQEFKDGKKPEDMSNFAFWSYLKPTQQASENGTNDQKIIKDKKNQAKSRLLIPLNYDSLMIILEDPFYQEYLSEEMTRSMRKKLISSMKKSAEQKPDQFIDKIYHLEQDLKKSVQVEEQEQPIQLGVIQSIFSVLNNEQDKFLDKEIKDLFDTMEVEPPKQEVNEIFEEAKQLFM